MERDRHQVVGTDDHVATWAPNAPRRRPGCLVEIDGVEMPMTQMGASAMSAGTSMIMLLPLRSTTRPSLTGIWH